MSYLKHIVLALCLSFNAFAQIPNPSLDAWTSEEPDQWLTNNAAPDFITITQSSTSRTGPAAARGVVVDVGFGFVVSPLLMAGSDGVGFPFTQRPGALTVYYQFSPVSGDQLFINTVLYKGGPEAGTEIAGGSILTSSAASSFTLGNIPLTYFSGETPDSAIIMVTIIGPGLDGPPHVGSFFIVDDFAFGGAVGMDNDGMGLPEAIKLEQNFPNPFNPETIIRYSLVVGGYATLKVYDVLGREVATLVSEVLPAGEHQAVWNASGLPSGIYTYRLTVTGDEGARSDFRTGRMILAK